MDLTLATPSLDTSSAAPRIHFTETWEDPRSDARALRLEPHDRVLAITAGGCTPLSLLAQAPVSLVSLDYNPAQTYLLELKVAMVRHFASEDVDRLLRSGERADDSYRQLRPELRPEARAYWDERVPLLERGLCRAGVATCIFYRVGRFLRRAFEPELLEQLFECRSIEEQRAFYHEHLDYPALRAVTSWVGPLLSGPRGRRALFGVDYFPHATEHNIVAFLWQRIEHALKFVPSIDNYFLSRVLLDRELADPEGRPPYLQSAGLEKLRSNLDRLEILTSPIEVVLSKLDACSIDRFQLSNVFEWMPEPLIGPVFTQLIRVAKPGARVLFRNLFTERTVPAGRTNEQLPLDEALSAELLETDRSFIYKRYYALRVDK